MERIRIVKQGITKLEVDCIVNAANEGLWAGGGVCGAIFREAGYEKLQEACNRIGHCNTGSAVITPGFNLKAKYIIHAVGPQWKGGNANEAELLRACYQSAIHLAKENGCESIAFPVISSGIYGYPKKEAWEVALKAVSEVNSGMDVYFAVIDSDMLEIGNRVYQELYDNSDAQILASIDKAELWECIEILCKIRKVEWQPSEVTGKTEDGKDILTFPFPLYPAELNKIFNLLTPDFHYGESMERWPEGLLPTDMTPSQIKTMLTYINRKERFCDGSIAAELENGTLLKLLLRLDDLIKK